PPVVRQVAPPHPSTPKEGPKAPQSNARPGKAPFPRPHQEGRKRVALGLPRPPQSQARLSRLVDSADQCRCAAERLDLRAIHERHEESRHRARPQGALRPRRARAGGIQILGRAGPPGAHHLTPVGEEGGEMARASQARRVIALVFTIALTLSACGGFDRDISVVKQSNASTGIANEELVRQIAGARGKIVWSAERPEKYKD